ncbi:UNKNOWN [Stylonychia lemnae]|uniref:Uncharacterized protein n=1 Tax=Stylonychia lemnae TaxID=5949 RepID=A0A078AKH6_STYLE|nr:UNKNOWN [Stylonychia lemnae]|eukprot:CDW82870.1 UNKNOWN [Stylonychia lemnae]
MTQPKLFESLPIQYHEELRKQLFQESAAQLMTLYKESIKRCEESYFQGKEDAYQEILKWFMSFNNGDFKHVSTYEFFNFITGKLQEHRTTKKKSPSGINLTSTTSNSGIPMASATGQNLVGQQSLIQQQTTNLNSTQRCHQNQQIQIRDNATNQLQSQGSNLLTEVPSQGNNNLRPNNISNNLGAGIIGGTNQVFASQKDNYIDILATVTEMEALNERINIVQKINFNLSNIKVQDSKKRRRPNSNYQDFQHILSKNQIGKQSQNDFEYSMEEDALSKQFYNKIRFKPSAEKTDSSGNYNNNGGVSNYFYLNNGNLNNGEQQLPAFHRQQQQEQQNSLSNSGGQDFQSLHQQTQRIKQSQNFQSQEQIVNDSRDYHQNSVYEQRLNHQQ